MDDYSRIALVIAHLDKHHEDQPTLSELAGVVGLSESHFHRLFRRWAGVTPKDFLQCLTAAHARQRLKESATVLDAALDSGLSGPGRLHDLTISLVAATPGEIRTGGADLTIRYGAAETPFGWATLGWTERGICHLAFHSDKPGKAVPGELVESWPNASLNEDAGEAHEQLDRIFRRSSEGPGLSAFVHGTPFQVQVWQALLRIPEGEVTSYAKLADAVGRPGAARAVGTACGKNPVGYLIPCHRVIRETGIIKGYRWGSERKAALLARESSQRLAGEASPGGAAT
ncbi:MAG: methylated-DNA--[protein]-cysteine S-methyltransferase [Verrucomicrobiales bacterium]|nr:methylated-DNA--[protein]-cysteine S-methyltransferase [Verrucomicrobiales bacterium]